MTEEPERRASRTTTAGDAVYAIGLVGAAVWYWRQANGAGEHVVGMLKAFAWPAFLVYDALKALHGLSISAGRYAGSPDVRP